MLLRITKDAGGKTEYSIEDEKGIRVVSESLASYRVRNGDVTNAYIDDTGVIRLNDDVDRRGIVGIKSDQRIKQERKAMSEVGSTKYRIVATVKDGDTVKGYVLRNDLSAIEKKVTVSTAIIYTSIGAVTNAKLEYKPSGEEVLVGIGINLSNLAVINIRTGRAEDAKTESSVKTADGVVDVLWRDITALKADTATSEVVDKRYELPDGAKYPRLSLLKRGALTVNIDKEEYDVSVLNIEELLKDETDTMIVKVKHKISDEVTKVRCLGATYTDADVLKVALIAFDGIRKMNRKAKLVEVGLRMLDGTMWRLFYRDNAVEAAVEDTGGAIEIKNDDLRAFSAMYHMSISKNSGVISVEEQNRLLRGLKINKAILKVMCMGETYKVTELIIRANTDARVDFTIEGTTGDTESFFYKKLEVSKVNIKNICVICASAVAKRAEIQRVSVEAVDRESEFLVEFRSKIRTG